MDLVKFSSDHANDLTIVVLCFLCICGDDSGTLSCVWMPFNDIIKFGSSSNGREIFTFVVSRKIFPLV